MSPTAIPPRIAPWLRIWRGGGRPGPPPVPPTPGGPPPLRPGGGVGGGGPPRVHVLDPHDPVRRQVVLQTGAAPPRAGKPGRLAHDEAGHLRPCRLHILRVGAVVADERVGHGYELPGVGRIGENLLIAGHGRVEDDFADGDPGVTEWKSVEAPPVFKQKAGRVDGFVTSWTGRHPVNVALPNHTSTPPQARQPVDNAPAAFERVYPPTASGSAADHRTVRGAIFSGTPAHRNVRPGSGHMASGYEVYIHADESCLGNQFAGAPAREEPRHCSNTGRGTGGSAATCGSPNPRRPTTGWRL